MAIHAMEKVARSRQHCKKYCRLSVQMICQSKPTPHQSSWVSIAAPAKTQRFSSSSGSILTFAWKMNVAPRWDVANTGQWYIAVQSISSMCTEYTLQIGIYGCKSFILLS